MQVFLAPSRFLNRKKSLILVAALFAAGAVTYSARALNAPAPAPPAAAEADPVRVISVTLRPTGFEPSEVSVPAGRYLLVVNNRTGLEQFTPRLGREGQGAADEAGTLRHKRAWKKALQLTPGQYALAEADRPEWVCRITVTP